ncbi:adenosine receptor A2b-like [Tubulanus polymorphus]|uniref:adenosine receptor A2b-like n=1 Tax=Tubulanus polymorphus TaxID=672921 RepID=UPI003DA5902C
MSAEGETSNTTISEYGLSATTGYNRFNPHPRCKFIHYSDYKPFYLNTFYQASNYVTSAAAIVGVVCNTLAYVALSSSNHRANTSILYLKYLAVFDVFSCASYLVFNFQKELYNHTLLLDMSSKINHAMKRASVHTQNSMLFFTKLNDLIVVIIAIDRYIVVCWPLRAKSIVTNKRARVKITVLFLVTFACGWTNWVRYTTRRSTNPCTGHERWTQKLTPLAKNLYVKYYDLFVTRTIMTIVPTVLLSCSTTRLIFTLKKARKQRQNLSGTSFKKGTSDERSLTLTLILISCVFLLKQVFSLQASVSNLVVLYTGTPGRTKATPYLNGFRNLSRMILATFNFVIYCASRRRFRHKVELILCAACKKM